MEKSLLPDLGEGGEKKGCGAQEAGTARRTDVRALNSRYLLSGFYFLPMDLMMILTEKPYPEIDSLLYLFSSTTCCL